MPLSDIKMNQTWVSVHAKLEGFFIKVIKFCYANARDCIVMVRGGRPPRSTNELVETISMVIGQHDHVEISLFD